jgi:predicted membrane-bound spermidine synthase/tetratricopeptide (TPR) repeat protein
VTRKINIVLYICLFLSGIAGLIYEVLWARYLSLIFGNTTHAHTLVLASFMGGLAIGSYLLGRIADRVNDKLTFYAWVEIGIATFCMVTPRLFALSKGMYLAAAKSFGLTGAGIIGIKFIIGACIILPPTILMGGTLPILGKFMIRSLSTRGKTIARLYYINSFGAVIGTFLAGFYFIYRFGLDLSVTIAAIVNLAVGCSVVVIKTLYKKPLLALQARQPDEPFREKTAEERPVSAMVVRIAIIGIFISGFVAMLYEVVWIRLLASILGSSTYSFSLMLAAFIFGITLGAFIISKYMPQADRAFLFFGVCEILIGVSLLLTLPLYEKLPLLFLRLSAILSRTPTTFVVYATIKFLLAFLVMLPATIFFGMTLPLVSKVASRRLDSLGKHVGGVFASNTAGNIMGAMVSGLVLLPMLGVRSTFELGIILNLLLGITVLFADKVLLLRRKCAIVIACCLAFVFFKTTVPDWNNIYFTAQLFRYNLSKIDIPAFFKQIHEKDILFYKDGLDSTVSVIRSKGTVALYINGKADASTGEDMPMQILCAQVPLLLKPDIQDVLVVGLGSGVTCGSALRHPLQSLDLVEISEAVVEAEKHFAEYNNHALDDERLTLFVEDARTYMRRIEKKYDLIISEPSNPWMSGIGTLFSMEYFRDCSQRLKPNGLMVQWVQSYDMNEEIFETIVRTFCSVFPEVTIWNTGVQDLLLIGSLEAVDVNFKVSKKRMAKEAIRAGLARIELHDLFTLLHLQLGSSKHVRDFIRYGGATNSDYFPILEYKAPLALYTNSSIANLIKELDERNIPLERGGLYIKPYLKDHEVTPTNLQNLFAYFSKYRIHNDNVLRALTKKWHDEYPEDKEARYAYALFNQNSLDESIKEIEGLIINDNQLQHLDYYAALLSRRYRRLRSYLLPEMLTETIEKLNMCIARATTEKATCYYILGNIFADDKDYGQAIKNYEAAFEHIDKQRSAPPGELSKAKLLNKIGLTYLVSGDLKRSHEYAQKALALDSTDGRAKLLLKFVTNSLQRQGAQK